MLKKKQSRRMGALACAFAALAAHAQSEAPAATSTPTPTLPAVTVSAESPTADIRKQEKSTPGATYHIDGVTTFYERPVNNMDDALRYVPGVSMNSDTGGSSGILSIRGSNLSALSYDNAGVLLLQDGLPVTTADGNNHNRLLDPLNASDVIVSNGPNALRYGASELGGAIDFISRTARNSNPRYGYLSGGSHGMFHALASTGGVSGNLDGMVTLERLNFDGWRRHSHEEQTNVYGNVGLKVNRDLDLRLFASHVNSRQKLAGSLTRDEFNADARQADPSYALGDHQIDVKTNRLALKGDWRIDARSRLEFGVSHERQSLYHPIVDVFDFSRVPPPQFFSLLIHTRQETTAGMARYHLDLGQHQLIAGVRAAYTSNAGGNFQNDFGYPGARTDNINQSANNFTLTALDRWHFAPRWTAVFGADAVSTHRNLADESLAYGGLRHQRAHYGSINPRVGLIREVGKNSELFANVSRVWQPPSNFDLDNDVRQNDQTLRPLHGISYEVGTRGRGDLPVVKGTGHWNVALYHARLHDEMLSVENPTQPGNMLSTNYGRTDHTGIEALLGASVRLGSTSGRIEPLVSASLNHFNFVHDTAFGNNRLPAAPRYVLHGEVMYRDAVSGIYAGPTFDLVGSRYADMANTYRVGAYGLLGLRAGIQKDKWEFYAEVRNLTNRKYANDLSPLTVADADARVLNPGAPRSVFVGLRMHY